MKSLLRQGGEACPSAKERIGSNRRKRSGTGNGRFRDRMGQKRIET